MLERQLAHLAGADDEDGLVAEVVEDLADVIDGGAGDRDVAAGDAGFGADALGDAAGVGKQGVQQRAGAVVLVSQLVGIRHLPGDLPLADDEAVEAGGDAEQVAHGVVVVADVQVRLDLIDGQAVEVGEEAANGVSVERRRGAGGAVEDAGQVQLDAVAGAEDDGFAVEARW